MGAREAGRRRGGGLLAAVLGLAVLASTALVLGAAALLGWRVQPIETGSMAPAYPAGSLAVVEPVAEAEIRPGMTVVFEDPLAPGRLIAHRVVKRLPSSSPMWQTRGDANAWPDPAPTSSSAIRGHVRWAIPHAGRALSTLDGAAVALFVALPLALLLVTEVAAMRRRLPA